MQIFSSPVGARINRRFLKILSVFAFGIILLSLFDHLSAPRRIFFFDTMGLGSAFGPFVSRNRLAAFGELVLPLFIAQALEHTGANEDLRGRLLPLGLGAAVFAAVIAGASRAGALIMPCELALLAVAARRRNGRTYPMRLGAAVCMFAVLAALFTATAGVANLIKRFEDRDPYVGRREMLESSIEMVLDRPWFGFGLGNFENAYPHFARFDTDKIVNHAHNDWAEWAADGGLPFFLLMCTVATWAARKAYRSVWAIGIIAVLAHSLVDFPMQSATIQFWVFTLVGMLGARESECMGRVPAVLPSGYPTLRRTN